MSIFILNFFLTGIWYLVCWLFIKDEHRRDITYLSIIFVQFSLFNFLKDYSVGQDLETYREAYEQIKLNGLEFFARYQWEPGFVLTNYLFIKLNISFRLFSFLIGAFFYISVLRFINRYSLEKWLSVMLFVAFGFYFASFHILRQTIAMGIILFAYDYIVKRNLKMFLLYVGMAVMFHYTAILFIVTYFLWSERDKRISMIRFITFLSICFIFNTWVIDFMMNTAYGYVTRYFAYQSSAVQGEGYGMLILLIAMTFSGMIMSPNYLGKRGKLLFLLVVIATCAQILATSFSVFARVVWYWSIAVIAYVPLIINLTDHPAWKYVLNIAAILFATLFFVFFTNAEDGIEVYATYTFMR